MAREGDGPRGGEEHEARKARLAAALRANLARRKAQARARGAATDKDDAGDNKG